MFKNKVDTYLRRAGYTEMKIVGLLISQWFPCPLSISAFGLDGKSCYILLNLLVESEITTGGSTCLCFLRVDCLQNGT